VGGALAYLRRRRARTGATGDDGANEPNGAAP